MSDVRQIKAFGPHENPETCAHAWEPHLFDIGYLYCPYCTSSSRESTDKKVTTRSARAAAASLGIGPRNDDDLDIVTGKRFENE